MFRKRAFGVVLLVAACLFWAGKPADGDPTKAEYIVISKEDFTLELFDSEDRVICSFRCAVGKNYGNKQRKGDMKTPEGEFYIEEIKSAKSWGHDFKDGKGYIPNCYGNWFMRLIQVSVSMALMRQSLSARAQQRGVYASKTATWIVSTRWCA